MMHQFTPYRRKPKKPINPIAELVIRGVVAIVVLFILGKLL